MVVEVTSWDQPWEIDLPREYVHTGRVLEARDGDGAVVTQWRQVPDGSRWGRTERGCGELGLYHFGSVLELCMGMGWRLWSLPADTGETGNDERTDDHVDMD